MKGERTQKDGILRLECKYFGRTRSEDEARLKSHSCCHPVCCWTDTKQVKTEETGKSMSNNVTQHVGANNKRCWGNDMLSRSLTHS